MEQILDRAALLSEMKLKQEKVKVGKGAVIVTEVSAAEYLAAYNCAEVKDEQAEFDGTRFAALLAVRCIVDRDGKRLFADDETDLLRNGSSTVYTKLIQAVRRQNGLDLATGKN